MSRIKPSSYEKQPSEKRTITISLSDVLPVGVTISSRAITVYDEDGLDVTTSLIDSSSIDSSNILVTIQNGTDGEKYYLKLLATLSNGNIVEGDLKIKIKEKYS